MFLPLYPLVVGRRGLRGWRSCTGGSAASPSSAPHSFSSFPKIFWPPSLHFNSEGGRNAFSEFLLVLVPPSVRAAP